jgi:AcrR family transcriptional regulator
MARALFAAADFIAAARSLAAAHGPDAVTVGSVTRRLKAPTGSFYHRFASRDLLLAELWLATAHAFQGGFVAAIEAGDGLAAALYGARWARAHPDEARLLLLYHRDDFVQGGWPAALKRGVAEQARAIDACFARFARDHLGGGDAERLEIARFLLADLPIAALRPHLRRREPPPPLVDELVRAAYEAVVARWGSGKPPRPARNKGRNKGGA